MRRLFPLTLPSVCRGVIASVVLTLALSPIAFGSEIRVICTQALKGTMAKIGPQYERETGDKLLITYGATAQLLTHINKGESVDVIIVVSQALADLAKSGKVVDSSRADVARSGIGVAIRRGGPRPDITTVDAFKKTLLAAKSIAYTNPADGGTSAVYFAELIKKLGIAEQFRPKTKFVPGGTSSGTLVASGEAELAVQFISELLLSPGVEIAGPLPPQVQQLHCGLGGGQQGSGRPRDCRAAGPVPLFPGSGSGIARSRLEPPK
jgi:molybdate transport system substrate-binding protein